MNPKIVKWKVLKFCQHYALRLELRRALIIMIKIRSSLKTRKLAGTGSTYYKFELPLLLVVVNFKIESNFHGRCLSCWSISAIWSLDEKSQLYQNCVSAEKKHFFSLSYVFWVVRIVKLHSKVCRHSPNEHTPNQCERSHPTSGWQMFQIWMHNVRRGVSHFYKGYFYHFLTGLFC